MFRNEQDLIEPFLRHASALFDLVVLMDNRSTDASRRIANATAKELGNIIVTDLPDPGYNQSETMSQALRYIQSVVFADFVFFMDVDEFFNVQSAETMFDALDCLPANSTALVPWTTYVADPEKPEAVVPDPLERMTLRRKIEEPQYYKAILRLAGGCDPTLIVSQGNHHITRANGKPLESRVVPSLELCHFPVRSAQQLISKGVIGWEANKARKNLDVSNGEATQWKRLHDLAQEDGPPDPVTISMEGLNYAQAETVSQLEGHAVEKPHGLARPRRYSDGSFAQAEALIAASRSSMPGMTEPFNIGQGPTDTEAETDVANAFSSAWHWDHMFLDEPPIRLAIERFAPKSVIDLGCGNGLYPLLYTHLGVEDVLGVDGIERDATVLGSESYTKADLQQPLDAGRKFDLVVCLEVVEHITPDSTDILIDSVARHAHEHILFSMAEPGQPGNGHINCKTIAQVLDMWALRGWHPDLTSTLGLRAVSTMSWFRRNIVLLEYTGDTAETVAATRLKQIGELDYEWYGQKPGQRRTAFVEPFPVEPMGYGTVLPG
jgi:SAM-dependent methyltransferase